MESLRDVYRDDSSRLGEKMYYLTFSHFDSFLAGASIVIFKFNRIKVSMLNFLLISSLILMLTSGFFLFMQINNGPFCLKCYLKDFGYNFDNIKFAWPYISITFFFFSLILNLVSEKKGIAGYIFDRIFSFSWLVSIGKISYGMYIIHRGCDYLMSIYRDKFPFSGNSYLFFVFYAGVVYILALLSFHLYEKRFLNLKAKFR
jgi:peptidoglycan/LPS O-acetylase OafA/YrhL